MARHRFQELTYCVIIALIASAFSAWSRPTLAQAATANAKVYHHHVETHPSQGPVRTIDGAEARIMTTEKGAFVHLLTHELTPGHVYTLWWVVINAPQACQTSPCTSVDVLKHTALTHADVTYGDGIIADANGKGAFNGFLAAGAIPNAWYGNGYRNAMGAEIHLVINDHGPLISEMASSMLHSYRGGCTDQSLPKPFPSTAKADGTPGPNTCRLVQVAIFQQS